MKRFLSQFLAGIMVFTMVVSVSSIVKATQPQHNQVRLCHHTEGGHYNNITVDDDAVFQQGHDQHQGGQDIIPPFDYYVWEVTGSHLECPNGYYDYGNPTQCRKWHGNHWDYANKITVDDHDWVLHHYAGKNWDAAGQVIWNNDCEVPPVDLCTNLEGIQAEMPQGYEDPDQDKVCTEIPVDLCCNLEGIQAEMPQGYEDPDQDKICTEIPPVDLCSNLEGNQETMPQGYEDPDQDKVCTEIQEPTDLCKNIEGIQTEIPKGYEDPNQDGVCTETTPSPSPSPSPSTHHASLGTKVSPQVLGTTAPSPSAEPLPVSGADINYDWVYYFLIIVSLMATYYLKVRGWQKIKI